MQEQQVRHMTLDELKQRMENPKPFILADARDMESYENAHIPGAIPVPVEDVNRLTDTYDRDIDIRKDVGGCAENCQDSRDKDEQCKNHKCVGSAQG